MTRRPIVLSGLLLAATTAVVAAVALDTAGSAGATRRPGRPTREVVDRDQLVAAGERLYLRGCVSCHGVGGAGTALGPPLLEAGEAAADFYLRTGRMPLAFPVPQPPDKPRAYSDTEIRALVAYVGSISKGPVIPDVDAARGDLSAGGQLYLSNCAACHNSSAIGGALSYGDYAPSLHRTATTQIGEAVRVGPGQMPQFGSDVLTDRQVDSIARYVHYLQHPDDAGGFNLGYTGPVPEGFVAFLFGLGALILAARWITREKESTGA